MCDSNFKGENRALTHCKFLSFLTEMEAEYDKLIVYTQVNWLSIRNCLKCFFTLRKEIKQFLEEHEKTNKELITELSDPHFNNLLGFLTDITQHMNECNLKLQGHNQNI